MFSLSEASARLVIYIIYCAADDATRTRTVQFLQLVPPEPYIKRIMCISTSIQAISTTTCRSPGGIYMYCTHGALSASSRHVLVRRRPILFPILRNPELPNKANKTAHEH